MSWTEQLQDLAVMFLMTAGIYLFATWQLRSLNPAGRLSWEGRRMRNGGTLFVLLFFGGCEVLLLYQGGAIAAIVAAALYAGLGLLFLLVVRWWWRDRQKEAAAREALVEKLHEEGRELTPPPVGKGRKAWRWAVNGYAIFLVAAGLYALLHYLLKKF